MSFVSALEVAEDHQIGMGMTECVEKMSRVFRVLTPRGGPGGRRSDRMSERPGEQVD